MEMHYPIIKRGRLGEAKTQFLCDLKLTNTGRISRKEVHEITSKIFAWKPGSQGSWLHFLVAFLDGSIKGTRSLMTAQRLLFVEVWVRLSLYKG